MGYNTSALTNSANLLSGQSAGLLNRAAGGYGQMGNIGANLTSLYGPLASIFGNIMSGPGAMTPQMMQQYMTMASNPQALAAMTGINAPGLMKGATNYLSQPGQTNMAQMFPGAMGQLSPGQSALNLGGGQAMDVFRNMAQQGINPQFATNAQNQLQQQFGTALGSTLAQAGPGQNTAAMVQNAQDQLLSSSANLGGQLAGQSQQIQAQGAQGMVGTGQAIDQNTLARVMSQYQMAGGLDQQTMNMLTQAANMGVGYNQQMLGNVGQGAQMGMSGLGGAAQLANTGLGALQGAAGGLGGLGEFTGQQAMDYTQLATQLQMASPNPWDMLSQGLGTAAGMYMGGGMTGGVPGKQPGGGGGGGNPLINMSQLGYNPMMSNPMYLMQNPMAGMFQQYYNAGY